MMEMNTACDQICSAADDDALIIFGHVHNPQYTGMMKITIIATGFEKPKVRERCPGPGIMDARKSQVNVATEPLIATAAISSARQAETLPGDNLHFSNPSPQKVEVPVQCLNDSIDLAPELSPPGTDKPAVDDELNESVANFTSTSSDRSHGNRCHSTFGSIDVTESCRHQSCNLCSPNWNPESEPVCGMISHLFQTIISGIWCPAH